MSSFPPSGAESVTTPPTTESDAVLVESLDPAAGGAGGGAGGGGGPAGGSGGTGDGEGGASGRAGGRRARKAAKPPRRGQWLIELVAIVLVALVLAVVLRTFVVQTFFIPSGSMEPTLQIGDRILVDKLSYHLHGVDRGDIIVFKRPADENCGGATVNDLVKRVVGLPGETISLSGGQVYINGKELAEPWLPASEQGLTTAARGAPWDLETPYKIPQDEYFVMGDNRTESCDSRYWGPVAHALIVGKVVVRVWPLSHFRFF